MDTQHLERLVELGSRVSTIREQLQELTDERKRLKDEENRLLELMKAISAGEDIDDDALKAKGEDLSTTILRLLRETAQPLTATDIAAMAGIPRERLNSVRTALSKLFDHGRGPIDRPMTGLYIIKEAPTRAAS